MVLAQRRARAITQSELDARAAGPARSLLDELDAAEAPK
jgi:hypothetical protein